MTIQKDTMSDSEITKRFKNLVICYGIDTVRALVNNEARTPELLQSILIPQHLKDMLNARS